MRFAKCTTYMEGLEKIEKDSQREPVEVEKERKKTQRRLEEWKWGEGFEKVFSFHAKERRSPFSKGSSESAKAELKG